MTINQRVRPSSLDVGWELFPDFVFRTTGFPYEWLQELQCPDTLTQAQAFLALEQEQKRLRDQFAESLFPSLLEFEQKREPVGSKVFSKLFKLKKRLLKNQALSPEEITFWESRQYENTEWEHFAVKWNRLHSELEKAFTLGEDIFALELARVRRVMKAKVEEPRFQEAVFLSSPSSFQQLHKYLKDWQGEQPPAWNSPARGVERMIFAYLQRFCSKNDTTSFFGPVNYGRFDADQPCSIRRSFHDGNDLGRRRVFIAHWFVQLVAQKLAGKKKVLLCLKPRANPLVRPLGDGKFHFHGLDRSFRLPDAQSRLLLAIDGEKTVSQIAKELQMEEEGIIDLLKEVQKKRLIQVSFPLSPVRVDALAELADHLGELPPEVRQAGEELIQRLEGYRSLLDRRIQKMPQWGHMATIITERRNKHVTPELPGHTILLSAVSGKEAAFSIPIHQVEVCEIDGRLTLWANDTPLIIYPGDLGSAAHGCFSLPSVVPIQFPIEEPVAEGKRSPRVVIDGVVVQREQWRIPAEGMQADSPALKGFPLFVHMARKQMQFDLPNQFFVKWKPGEKPIGADLSNPWSLEWLVRVADRTEQRVVSEMYPGPEDLWWQDDIGLHTFELRTGYFYDHTAGKRMKQEVRWER